MKIQRVLSLLTIPLFVASCSNDDADGQEIIRRKSYVNVSIVSPSNTSRALGGFDVGTDSENEVTKATFFFFDADGNGCVDPVSPPLEFNSGTASNVEKVSEAMVVLSDPTAQPTSVVVVLNPSSAVSALTKTASLSTLRSTVDPFTITPPFTMSNSTYLKDGNTVVDATPISASQICATPDEAIANPIIIPVERVVAKVTADLNGKTGSATQTINGSTTNITVKLLGWKVTETVPKSFLLKSINASWDEQSWWNDEANYRSYWADSYIPVVGESYNYFSYSDIIANNDAEYCLENTTNATNQKTKLIVAAQLVDATDTPIDLMEWKGTKYTKANMKVLLASTEDVKRFYTLDSGIYSSLPAAAIDFTMPTGTITNYNVVPTVSDAYKSLTIYRYTAGVMTPVPLSTVNQTFATLGEIKYWNQGATYFYVDIEHRGGNLLGNLGVVRNHTYALTITAVNGLGTPVPDKNTLKIDPEKPDEDHSFIAASVSVMSWKAVSQSVVLE